MRSLQTLELERRIQLRRWSQGTHHFSLFLVQIYLFSSTNYLFLNHLPHAVANAVRRELGMLQYFGVINIMVDLNSRYQHTRILAHGEMDLVYAFDLEQFFENELGLSSR